MGSSEGKMEASAPVKPEPALKNFAASHLRDPRSPSTGVDRTPIQVDGLVTKSAAARKSECPLAFTDPRSPSVGVNRTPVRDVMRARVGSFAQRLGMLFHSETEGKVIEAPQKRFSGVVEQKEEEEEEEVVFKGEELASTEPLLSPQSANTLSSLAEHANLLATPVSRPLQLAGDLSPFVILEEPQVEVELSLEEAEEARESPLHKRLSMSLITYHEGETSSQIFADVHCDAASSPAPSVKAEPLEDGADHSYALPSITVEPHAVPSPSTDLGDPPVQTTPAHPGEAEKLCTPGEAKAPLTVPSSEQQQQLSDGIRCPTFDPKSPSQVVFKPQWLGRGFGASGLRARGVQGRGGKGGSSPLAVRLAVKNATNENRGQTGKLKQKGTEGRSPLQILKETNSPRDKRSQVRQKVSTPDKQRTGQVDRRVLAVALDKENR